MPPSRRASRSPSRTATQTCTTNQPGRWRTTMATSEVQSLRDELASMKAKGDKNGPKSGTTASLRTGAGGRIESVLVRFGTPVDGSHGDGIVASLEEWGD